MKYLIIRKVPWLHILKENLDSTAARSKQAWASRPTAGSALTQIRQQQKGLIPAWYKGFWVRKSGYTKVLLEPEKVRCINMH